MSEAALRQRLVALRGEHAALAASLAELGRSTEDMVAVARIKKRKLLLKDEIAHIESRLIPDIIA